MSRRSLLSIISIIVAIGGVFLVIAGLETERRTVYVDCGGTIAECQSAPGRNPIVTVERDPARLAIGGMVLALSVVLIARALRMRETSATSGSSSRTAGG
jgi:hypothetical protein